VRCTSSPTSSRYALADVYASEHVQIFTEQPRALWNGCATTGPVLGDKTASPTRQGIGTNHVLPTLARPLHGGLWVGKYLRPSPTRRSRPTSSAQLGEICGRASRLENFEGHARSGDVRNARYGSARLDWTDHRFDER